jgi:hypothetical protein
MCLFTGQPMDMTSMISPWAEQLGQQTAGMIGQGMQQGATPMPRDLFGLMMQASQVPNFAYGPMQYLSQMYGGGMPFQPMQFNPMDLYASIYQPPPTAQGPRYTYEPAG